MDDADEGPWALAGAPVGRFGDTVRDRVARELRDRILTGRHQRDERLDLDAVAAELGVSRTPVREACLALQTEGLLRMAPRSGVTVIGLEPGEVVDNFRLMARLSGFAAELAAERMTSEELADVETSQEAMRSGDRLAEHNWRFHRDINRASRSRRLISLIAQTGRTIPRTFLEVFPQHVPCALDEHDELVAALRRGDGVAAREVTERHYAVPAELLSGHHGS
ncbi:GntR family transcriptional regulator [Actinomycetospora termitidis]|uniref:GntR family transcriptional regulator n=1 Tax=Actinomycetospora termitidis TaxID=3053470 RepID=A0ABT7M5T2_9PSEU|nr:GntR family transcriptional regulator [Actinomycetospora sp. Odt1-22]MDL5156030.1 GntR family transcriptional regulator [Actinomycetospora sp. Odt1-22]